MVISIELLDRIYNDIVSYCTLNNINLQDYFSQLIEDGHNINKYGDLNKVIESVTEKSTVENKKRVKRKKEIDSAAEEIIEKKEESQIIEENVTEETIKDTKEEIVTPTAKRKRSLKTL